MNPVRIIIVLVAGVAAIVLALFVRNIASPPKHAPTIIQTQAPAPPMARVLVAKVNLAVGDRLSADNMAWQPWPAATLNAAYITDSVTPLIGGVGAAAAVSKASTTVKDLATGGGPKMQAVVGDIVREPIYAGEPITDLKIVASGDSSYMAVRLPQGMRAVGIPVNVETSAGGFVQPGDRVDIFSSHADNQKGGSGQIVTQNVLSNVLVLAVDQKTESGKAGAAIIGTTLTIEVPEAMVPVIARARAQGGIYMSLRSYADIGGPNAAPTGGVNGGTVRLFKGGAPAELVTAQ